MRRREFITLLGGAALWPLTPRAQQTRIYTIGYLAPGSITPLVEVITDALRELGWVEGKNVTFERRYADNHLEQLPELAAELVRLSARSRLNARPLQFQ